MKEYFTKLFKNNGVARGWLYIVIALATNLGDDLYAAGQWLVENREMLINRPFSWVDIPTVSAIVCAKVALAAAAAGNTLRAYMDQHLTRTKVNNEENATTVITKP